jgi:hypothetical protein
LQSFHEKCHESVGTCAFTLGKSLRIFYLKNIFATAMALDSGPIALRAQALTLLKCSISIKTIIELTSLSKLTIFCIRAIAKERGYDPAISTIF